MFVIGIKNASTESAEQLESKLSVICNNYGYQHRICTYEDTEELKSFIERAYMEEGNTVPEDKINKDYIELYYQRFKHKIKLKDIKYIEAYNGYTEFLVGNKRFRREESLKEIEELIDMSMFVKIQRSFIVNLIHIKSYENMEVEVGGVRLTVSRRRRRSFEEIYTRYQISTSDKMSDKARLQT